MATSRRRSLSPRDFFSRPLPRSRTDDLFVLGLSNFRSAGPLQTVLQVTPPGSSAFGGVALFSDQREAQIYAHRSHFVNHDSQSRRIADQSVAPHAATFVLFGDVPAILA
jgi:hypothetical protein